MFDKTISLYGMQNAIIKKPVKKLNANAGEVYQRHKTPYSWRK